MKHPRLIAVLAIAVAALTACGIPSDKAPRDVAPSERLQLAQPNAPSQVASSVGPKVYFLSSQNAAGQDRLQASGRNVVATPEAVLTELLNGLTSDEQARRWRTAIPSDTSLLTPPELTDGTLVVNLSTAFFEVKGEPQVKAVAQIVFTATALPGVHSVKILVNGQPQGWPRGDGTAQPVGQPLTQFAYPDLNPTSEPDYLPAPSPTTSSVTPTTSVPAPTTSVATVKPTAPRH
jgi:spore germination protein GerM